MEKKYILVIFAAEPLLDDYKRLLLRDAEFTIAFASSCAEDVLAYLERSSAPKAATLLVVDDTQQTVNLDFLRSLSSRGVPLVAVAASVNGGFKLMENGASDMIVRNTLKEDDGSYFFRMLAVRIRETARKYQADRTRSADLPQSDISGKIIAIGSSTGGTETVLSILKQLPVDAPPVLVVQHMPPVFTKLYAERANNACAVKVWEAKDGDRLANGLVLIAPGDYHMTLEKANGQLYVECKHGERILGQCPSADVLFHSVARTAKANAVGVILTGMGADGAQGLLDMRKQGAFTIGQDEKTCVVYGMPRAAYELGAVDKQLPLEKIPQEIMARAVSN